MALSPADAQGAPNRGYTMSLSRAAKRLSVAGTALGAMALTVSLATSAQAAVSGSIVFQMNGYQQTWAGPSDQECIAPDSGPASGVTNQTNVMIGVYSDSSCGSYVTALNSGQSYKGKVGSVWVN